MLLSLCLIVKNEEKFLEQCLQSVQGLVEEIIIVDTGSTDRTKEIAQQFTSKVYNFTWGDDFSAARNVSLKQATGQWILILDADETISRPDHSPLRTLLEAGDVTGYILTQRNYIKDRSQLEYQQAGNLLVVGRTEEGFVSAEGDSYPESKGLAGWLPTPIVRLFRNKPGVAFSGAVHEDVSPSLSGKIIPCSIPIHHFGKLDQESWQGKGALYERLGKKKVEQQERDYFAYYELGRQYLANQKVEEAKEMLLKSVSLQASFWISWFTLGTIHLLQGKIQEAQACLERAMQCNPTAVVIYENLGVVHAQRKEFQRALDCFVAGLHRDPQHASIYRNMGLCYQEMGDAKRAQLAFKKAVELNPAYGRTQMLG